MEWQAKWVWGSTDKTPRNSHLSVRREVTLPAEFKQVSLALTGDSRYTVWFNGQYLGQGPVRAFLGRWTYDTYDVTALARPGANVIAILVEHFGVSTFQYLLGQAGVLAQLDVDDKCIAATDRSWQQCAARAFSRYTPRISCQQAFAEEYDARQEYTGWQLPGFTHADWGPCVEIDAAGAEPWGALLPRPIPFLTQQPVYATRLVRGRVVKPPAKSYALDVKHNVKPGDRSANPDTIRAFVATVVTNGGSQPEPATVSTAHAQLANGKIRLNGKDVALVEGAGEITLPPGPSILAFDISGRTHDFMVYPVLDHKVTANIAIASPIDPQAICPWVVVGPFTAENEAQFAPDWSASTVAALKGGGHCRPIPRSHYSSPVTFATTAMSRVLPEVPVEIKQWSAMLFNSPDYTTIRRPVDGDLELLLDFGKETVGYLEFDLSAPAGVVIEFNAFEYLGPNNPDSIQWTNGLNNTLKYTTRAGWQKYRSITRRGFRYAVLVFRFPPPEETKEPVCLRNICCHQNTYPYSDRGDFRCSDDLLNNIWEICRHTVRLCSEDTFVDCPAYEQTFWVGDARNEALYAYLAFGDYALARRSLILAAESLNRSDLVESQVPSGWQEILPAWALLWAIACYEHVQYTDDAGFAELVFPALKKQAETLRAKYTDARGLFSIKAWNMLDWAAMDTPGEGVVSHQNMWAVLAYERSADLADSVGQAADATAWRLWASELRAAINTHLWDEETQAYVDCLRPDGTAKVFSQQTQVVAYLCEVVPEARVPIVEKYLVDVPDGWVQVGSPFMMAFVLESLAKSGDYTSLINLIRSGWGLMVINDATTCWETFPRWNDPSSKWFTRSHCHAWSAAPLFSLAQSILGVQPLEPGFKRFKLRPHLEDLDWVRGTVPTPSGNILVECTKDDDGNIHVEFRVPKGTVAVVGGAEFLPGRHTLDLEVVQT